MKPLALVLVLSLAGANAHAATFDPHFHDYAGPQLITFVDTDAAPIQCIGMALETRDVGLAVAGLIAPIAACTHWTPAQSRCVILAPISPGVGQVVAAVSALTGPDELLGHEFRHCRDHDFHPAILPFVESSR